MKLFSAITDGKDIVNKDYVDTAISGKMAFVATYDQTPYADVVAAIDANLPIIVDFPNNHNLMCVTYSTYGAAGSDVVMYAVYNYNGNPALSEITVKSTNAWSIKHTALQEALESGINIKTINNQSLLGGGNIDVGGSDTVILTYGETEYSVVKDAIDNNKRIVVNRGSVYYPVSMYSISAYPGDIFRAQMCSVNSSIGYIPKYIVAFTLRSDTNEWAQEAASVQEQLQSGVNVKTINNQSILGSGNLDIGGGTVDTAMSDTSENAVQNKVIKGYVDGITGDLSNLNTDTQTNIVDAINEVYEKSGEPFRVKQWASNKLNVNIVPCTSDLGNTNLDKMIFSIDAEEGASYQIVGMISYEVFDAESGGNRINCWPVCQFTGNGQKELSVRWMCGGTTTKVGKRISAWVLLKHR